MKTTVQTGMIYGQIKQAVAGPERQLNFNIADLQRIERQLIPLLNTVRQLQGKPSVIVPTSKRVSSE